MRCRKDLALGSAPPCAEGFRTVYGWQDGESSQSDAFKDRRLEAESVDMSVCLDYDKRERERFKY